MSPPPAVTFQTPEDTLSVPGGMSREGIPIGLQLIAPAFDEATLLRAAHAYQTVTDWHTRRPPLAT